MSDPALTVGTAATYPWLVTLTDLKQRLGVDTTAPEDAELLRLIKARSRAILAWCGAAPDQLGRRTFSRETMTATWLRSRSPRSPRLRMPWRIPLVTVATITEDGLLLEVDEYRVVPTMATIERVDPAAGGLRCWSSAAIEIAYTAGWIAADDDATDMPEDLQEACMQECVTRFLGRDRDPSLRSETTPDVHQYAVAFGQDGARHDLLPETMDALAAAGYRRIVVP